MDNYITKAINKNNQIIVNDCDSIDSMNTYCGEYIKTENFYIIQVISLGYGEDVQSEDELYHIDKAYLVFINYKFIEQTIYHADKETVNKIYGNNYLNTKVNTFYICGEHIGNHLDNKDMIYTERQVDAESCYIQLLENSKISNNLFLPIDTTNQKANMNLKEVRNFVTNKYLPENLRKLIQ